MNKKCPICKKKVRPYHHRTNTHKKCRNDWKRKQEKKYRTRYKKTRGGTRKRVRCHTCKKPFYATPYKITHRKHKKIIFDKTRCYKQWMRNEWAHPHKGQPISEWWTSKKRAEKFKKEVSRRSKKMMRTHPELTGKGRTLEERFGKSKAEKMRNILYQNSLKTWNEQREAMLAKPHIFKKGMSAHNKGKKAKSESIQKAKKTKEEKYLKKLGLKK